MQIANLKVPCTNTTLMGVVRGVADYFGLGHSDAMLYGATSHAFLINIHEALCPSGPYCWNPQAFRSLLKNLGMEVIDHGFFSHNSSPEERAAIEGTLKALLDEGTPCALLNMENQLITGYDDTGFTTTQPWAPHVDFPPAHLTFGSWEELGAEIHMNFFSYARLVPAGPRDAIAASLRCGADMFEHPERYTREPYGVGPRAYDQWIGAIENGLGDSHGNWWNGTVWTECRSRAAEYLNEVGQRFAELAEVATRLAGEYKTIAANLARASDKELPAEEKLTLLRQTRELELAAAPQLGDLAAALES